MQSNDSREHCHCDFFNPFHFHLDSAHLDSFSESQSYSKSRWFCHSSCARKDAAFCIGSVVCGKLPSLSTARGNQRDPSLDHCGLSTAPWSSCGSAGRGFLSRCLDCEPSPRLDRSFGKSHLSPTGSSGLDLLADNRQFGLPVQTGERPGRQFYALPQASHADQFSDRSMTACNPEVIMPHHLPAPYTNHIAKKFSSLSAFMTTLYENLDRPGNALFATSMFEPRRIVAPETPLCRSATWIAVVGRAHRGFRSTAARAARIIPTLGREP